MDKIKRYIDTYIDTETCNLRCHYCYIAQLNKFNNKLASFGHTKEEIRKALSKKRLGGTCLINLCAGGETLLSNEVVPVIKELLLEGHYVMVVTNGTVSHRFKEICNFDKKLLERLFFKFSYHYLELKRLNFLEIFFENVDKVRNAGASFTLEITPSDELIPYIDEIKEYTLEKIGALPHITIARDDRTNNIDILTKVDREEYNKIWGSFDSKLFEFKNKIFYEKRKEFCYAGEYSAYLNLSTGDLRQCLCGYVMDNIYTDLDKPIKFEAIGNNCELPHCYNGHSFLILGDIPDLEVCEEYNYADLRNRCDKKGEWLKPSMKSFMSSKLYENNDLYDEKRKKQINKNYKIKRIKYKMVKLKKKVFNKC
ncbi:MAG: radical SAM protein [Bacilli bacterium]|nr:radical SAM protein [Bacilli bacterium]